MTKPKPRSARRKKPTRIFKIESAGVIYMYASKNSIAWVREQFKASRVSISSRKLLNFMNSISKTKSSLVKKL